MSKITRAVNARKCVNVNIRIFQHVQRRTQTIERLKKKVVCPVVARNKPLVRAAVISCTVSCENDLVKGCSLKPKTKAVKTKKRLTIIVYCN